MWWGTHVAKLELCLGFHGNWSKTPGVLSTKLCTISKHFSTVHSPLLLIQPLTQPQDTLLPWTCDMDLQDQPIWHCRDQKSHHRAIQILLLFPDDKLCVSRGQGMLSSWLSPGHSLIWDLWNMNIIQKLILRKVIAHHSEGPWMTSDNYHHWFYEMTFYE